MRSLAAIPGDSILMGVLNVTPDSFFDGGMHADPSIALRHGLRLVAEGAGVIDVGGESTRPGAALVSPEEELARVVPVIAALRRESDVYISIDTNKAEVAAAALDAGADCINDVSAGRFDPEMAHLAARRGCDVILMHSRETPQTMQDSPRYIDPMGEVCAELRGSAAAFLAAGVSRARIFLDPGIGFAKGFEDNLDILRRLPELVAEGFPVVLGTSRKSIIGTITGRPVSERLAGSLASIAWGYLAGVRIFRVHDVAESRDCLSVLAALGTGAP